MNELIIRIKSSDFSEFAGYYHTDESYTKNNEVLNEYIRLYKTNDDIRYLQIECDRHFSIDTIAYICNRVDEKYFIKTDFADKNKENKYWLCFHKERTPKERDEEISFVVEERGEMKTREMDNACCGCVYENIDDTTEDIAKCVSCKRNVEYAKNDYYMRKEDAGDEKVACK